MKGELLPGTGSMTPFIKIELCLHKEATWVEHGDTRAWLSWINSTGVWHRERFHKTRVLRRHFHASCCTDMHITWDLPSFRCSLTPFFNVLVVSIPFYTLYTYNPCVHVFCSKISVLSWVDLDFSLLGLTSNRDSTRFAEFDTIPLQQFIWIALED